MKFKRITKERGCPECGGSDEYRVKREGFYVKAVSLFLNVRPHYCPNCDMYFFAPRRAKWAQPAEPAEPVRAQQRANSQLHPRSLTH
jgi:hypothetical protein